MQGGQSFGHRNRPLNDTKGSAHLMMTTDVMSKQVHVLCDYDALFAAIELKLSGLAHVDVIRLEMSSIEPTVYGHPAGKSDLIIVAPVPPINDPMSILSNASLLGHIGRVPLLVDFF